MAANGNDTYNFEVEKRGFQKMLDKYGALLKDNRDIVDMFNEAINVFGKTTSEINQRLEEFPELKAYYEKLKDAISELKELREAAVESIHNISKSYVSVSESDVKGLFDLQRKLNDIIKKQNEAVNITDVKKRDAVLKDLQVQEEKVKESINKEIEPTERLLALQKRRKDLANQLANVKARKPRNLAQRQKQKKEINDLNELISKTDNEIKLTTKHSYALKEIYEKILDNGQNEIKDSFEKYNESLDKANEKLEEISDNTQKAADNSERLANAAKDAADGYNAVSAALKSVWQWMKDCVKYNFEFEQAAYDTGKAIGLSQQATENYHKTMLAYAPKLIQALGLPIEEILNFQKNYSSATGRATLMTKEQMHAFGAMTKLLGEDTTISLTEEMDKLGNSIYETSEQAYKLFSDSSKMGINLSKASAAFVKNMELAHRFNFKNGVDGVRRMTLLSERLKFNLQSVAEAADKMTTVEGAISTAANVQKLGGAFSMNFADPMRLMYESWNDFEGLTDRIIDTVSARATFNRKSGEMEMGSLDRRFLQEFAKSLGMNFEDVYQMATQQAKYQDMESSFQKGLSEEQKTALSNRAVYNPISGQYEITYFDKEGNQRTRALESINSKMAEEIMIGNDTDNAILKKTSDLLDTAQAIRDGLFGTAKDYQTGKEKTQALVDIDKTAKAKTAEPARDTIKQILDAVNDIYAQNPVLANVLINGIGGTILAAFGAYFGARGGFGGALTRTKGGRGFFGRIGRGLGKIGTKVGKALPKVLKVGKGAVGAILAGGLALALMSADDGAEAHKIVSEDKRRRAAEKAAQEGNLVSNEEGEKVLGEPSQTTTTIEDKGVVKGNPVSNEQGDRVIGQPSQTTTTIEDNGGAIGNLVSKEQGEQVIGDSSQTTTAIEDNAVTKGNPVSKQQGEKVIGESSQTITSVEYKGVVKGNPISKEQGEKVIGEPSQTVTSIEDKGAAKGNLVSKEQREQVIGQPSQTITYIEYKAAQEGNPVSKEQREQVISESSQTPTAIEDKGIAKGNPVSKEQVEKVIGEPSQTITSIKDNGGAIGIASNTANALNLKEDANLEAASAESAKQKAIYSAVLGTIGSVVGSATPMPWLGGFVGGLIGDVAGNMIAPDVTNVYSNMRNDNRINSYGYETSKFGKEALTSGNIAVTAMQANIKAADTLASIYELLSKRFDSSDFKEGLKADTLHKAGKKNWKWYDPFGLFGRHNDSWFADGDFFANGGVVKAENGLARIPGNRYQGDKVQVHANSGEMILNQSQQSALFNWIDNMSSKQTVFNTKTDYETPTFINTDYANKSYNWQNIGSKNGAQEIKGSLDLNINGTINLNGGGQSLDLRELINNPSFKRELANMILTQMSKNNFGGKMNYNDNRSRQKSFYSLYDV